MPELLWGFDIFDDGRAAPVTDADIPPDGQAYRWVHFDLATPDLEPWLADRIPELAAAALAQSETRPRCERLGDGILLNLRGVNLNPGASVDDMISLRLWLAPGLVVTTRLRQLMALSAVKEDCDAGNAPSSIAAFVDDLTIGLTDRLEGVVLELEDQADGMEEAMFHPTSDMGSDLARLRQRMIKLRRFVGPQRDAMVKLSALDTPLLDGDTLGSIRRTTDRITRAVEALDAARDRLMVVQDHIDAQAAQTLGRNSYILSVVAAIFLPLGFVTGLFGVNVAGMPGTEWAFAFALLCLTSAAIGLALYWLFRRMKWL
ncbi:zinc transporter ZntB [Litoreibacter roseus]|uniref:Zinc transport protein ZntB n=1 Tax=Litoreibacter roseus TaxID=2601869 RepID=A0A6N6JFT0_9RHOB|nr:zinc transporter ZntB [Litoreibacter roseus]GFE64994.1 zinc transport protein ZntB [Litoreibacter roseus]